MKPNLVLSKVALSINHFSIFTVLKTNVKFIKRDTSSENIDFKFLLENKK